MKVGVYARVSTADKAQNPETQLMHLRDFCNAQGWDIYREYVDTASALDVAHRTAWKCLLDDDAKRKFKVVLVFKSNWTGHSARSNTCMTPCTPGRHWVSPSRA
jgi:DNA invertase Pin-like site-specific DNA recombinase